MPGSVWAGTSAAKRFVAVSFGGFALALLVVLLGGRSAQADSGSGQLRVTTNPPLPSQILVNGEARDTWALTWVDLAPGTYTVTFVHVEGYTEPAPQQVTVVAGQATTLEGVFVPRGLLRVVTDPPTAGTILVDGIRRNRWGVWTDIPVGSHEVCFAPVRDRTPPPCQTVDVNAGQTTTVTGAYTSSPGTPGPGGVGFLKAKTNPPVPSQLLINGVPADTWGLNDLELPTGTYSLSYAHIEGWDEPAPTTVNIVPGLTTNVTGLFTRKASLRVVTSPPSPAAIWVDGLPRDNWGMWTDLAAGTYTVCAAAVPGLRGSPCATASLTAGELQTVTLDFLVGPTEAHVCADIRADQRWDGPATYVVDCHVTVAPQATVTVRPGLVAKFAWQASVQVDGTLVVDGVPDLATVFTSLDDDTFGGDTNGDGSATTPAPGRWRGVQVSPTGTLSAKFWQVTYGGSVSASPQAQPFTLVDSGFRHNEYGISVSTRRDVTVARNVLDQSGGIDITTSLDPFIQFEPSPTVENNSVVDGQDVYGVMIHSSQLRPERLMGNTGSGLLGVSGNMVSNWTLPQPGLPISVLRPTSGGLTVAPGTTLTANAGASIKFETFGSCCINAGIAVNGSLDVNGTASNPVVFTSLRDDSIDGDWNRDGDATTPRAGDWGGVFVSQSGLLDASHWIMTFGNGVSSSAQNQTFSVVDSVFRDNNGGISVSAQRDVTIARNVLDDSRGIDVSTQLDAFIQFEPSPTVQNNSIIDNDNVHSINVSSGRLRPERLTGNTGSGLLAVTGTMVSNWTLPQAGLPIGVRYPGLTVAAGVSLTANAGTIVKVDASHPCCSWSGVTIHGTLDVNGTAANPVVFTSLRDDSVGGDSNKDGLSSSPAYTDWAGVSVSASGLLDASHWQLTYSGNVSGSAQEQSFTIVDSVLRHNSAGISVGGQRDITIARNVMEDSGGISVSTFLDPFTQFEPSPTVQDNSIVANENVHSITVSSTRLRPERLTGNTGSGLLAVSGTMVSNWTLPQPGLAIGVRSAGLTIAPGVTLTVNAGTVIKFDILCCGAGIAVDGALDVNGTTANPVVLTSITDDSVGGDTNKDGLATSPSPGNWSGVVVNLGTADFVGAKIRYTSTALSSNAPGTVRFRGEISSNGFGASACGSCLIDARSTFWGDLSGPFPYGDGDQVGGSVDVIPWIGWEQSQAAYFGSGGRGGYAGSATGSYSYWHRGGGDPVDVATGAFSLELLDVHVPEPGEDLAFYRHYSSLSLSDAALGPRWTHSWETRINPTSDAGTADIRWGDGRIDAYLPGPGGALNARPGNFTTLVQQGNGSYVATTKDRVAYSFDAAGVLQKVEDTNGNELAVSSDLLARPTVVTDESGRTLSFAYTGNRLTKVTDPAGRETTLAYSAAGDLVAVTDPAGGTVTYDYGDDHHLVQAKDANGNVDVVNVYDSVGRVTSQANALGETTTFSYDPPSGLTTKTDPNGGVRRYQWGTEGRLNVETDPVGLQTSYTYDENGFVASITDPRGEVVLQDFDARGNLVSHRDAEGGITDNAYDADLLATTTDPTGSVTAFEYDSRRNLVAITDALSNEWTYSYDSRGLRTKETDPLGNETPFAYDGHGNRASATDAIGRTATWTHDVLGRALTAVDPSGATMSTTYNLRSEVASITDPTGGVIAFEYDAVGNRVTEIDPLGASTTHSYNPADRQTASVDRLGATTSFEYDANGNQLSVTDPTGSETSQNFDAANRPISTRNALGETTTQSYDGAGNVTSTTDPLGHAVSFGYDGNDNPILVIDPLGNRTELRYDGAGRLVELIDGNNHSWSLAYDGLGRLVSRTDPLGRSWSYAYDGAGRLLTMNVPGGGTHTYTYDDAGQRVGASYPGGASAAYAFDPAGRLTQRTDTTGTLDLDYDDLGRLTGATDGAGQAATWTYNAAGRITSRTHSGVTVTFAYDAEGRLLSVADPAGSSAWSYDAAATITGATLPNGVTLGVASDGLHRPTTIDYQHGGSPVFTESLVYDGAGRVTSIGGTGGSRTYGYDAADRLIGEVSPAGEVAYSYDAVGNRLTRSDGVSIEASVYDAADQLVSAGPKTFSYDQRGNLTAITDTATSETQAFSWNAQDFLVGSDGPDGPVTYEVDDEGLLLSSTDGSGTATYLFDRATGGIDPQATTGASTTRTLAGPMTYAFADGEATNTVLADHLGTVRGTVSAAGTVDVITYDAWGKVEAGTPRTGLLGYAQGLTLPEDLVRLGERMYSPASGRFLSPERSGLRESSSTMSPYAYARNNAIGRVDPSGQYSLNEWGHAVDTICRVWESRPRNRIIGLRRPAGQRRCTGTKPPTSALHGSGRTQYAAERKSRTQGHKSSVRPGLLVHNTLHGQLPEQGTRYRRVSQASGRIRWWWVSREHRGGCGLCSNRGADSRSALCGGWRLPR